MLFKSLNQKIVDRYGLGVELRRYGYYPQFLPITISGEHGPSLWDKPIPQALEAKSKYYCITSKRKLKWDFKAKKPLRHPSPFVWYRRREQIKLKEGASGSVFFLSHSSSQVIAQFDFNKLFEAINKLPHQMLPITFCLHFNDIREEILKPIKEKDYNWFCLSNTYEDNQIEEFYKKIPEYKYAIGNSLTTGFLYCTEMGMPVSLIEYEDAYYINNGNEMLDDKIWGKSNMPEMIKFTEKLYRGVNLSVSKEQEKFVYDELGLDLIESKTNRLEVSFKMYYDLFLQLIRLLYVNLTSIHKSKYALKIRQKLRLRSRFS